MPLFFQSCNLVNPRYFSTKSLTGAGYDQIDIPPCTAHHIHVSNVPTAVDTATADTALFLLLGALRGFNLPLQNLRAGSWRGDPAPPLGHDPEGKVLGILGMGGIGRNLKKKVEALGMKVQYHNRKKLDEELSEGAKYVGFEELLGTSDVISLNLPLNVSFLGLNVGRNQKIFYLLRSSFVLRNYRLLFRFSSPRLVGDFSPKLTSP